MSVPIPIRAPIPLKYYGINRGSSYLIVHIPLNATLVIKTGVFVWVSQLLCPCERIIPLTERSHLKKLCYQHSVVSQKRNKHPVPNKRVPCNACGVPYSPPKITRHPLSSLVNTHYLSDVAWLKRWIIYVLIDCNCFVIGRDPRCMRCDSDVMAADRRARVWINS